MGNMNLSDDKNSEMICLKAVLRIRIRKILGSRIRITNQKLQQNFLLVNPKSELFDKEIIKISSSENGSLSFRIKISRDLKSIFC